MNNKKNTKFAYAINAPLIIYLACVLLGPIIWGIWMSFTNKTIGGDAVFIGLDNYITLLADEEYRRSILNTLVFTFFSIVGKCFFGILMALALNIKFKGRNNKPYISEKSIIRPTFSYLGNFTISDTVFRQIIEHVAKKDKSIYSVIRTRIDNQPEGPYVYIEVIVEYGSNVRDVVENFKNKVIKELEKLTTMRVRTIKIVIKDIHIEK